VVDCVDTIRLSAIATFSTWILQVGVLKVKRKTRLLLKGKSKTRLLLKVKSKTH